MLTIVLSTLLLAFVLAFFKYVAAEPEGRADGLDSPLRRGLLQDFTVESLSDVAKEPDLPKGWWTSDELLDSERRAVFANVWSAGWFRERY
jgi:hypothetical protein